MRFSDNLSDGFAFYLHKTAARQSVARHDHDFWELVYITKGHGTCRIGNDSFDFMPHQVILTPPFIPHEFSCHDGADHDQLSLTLHNDLFDAGFLPDLPLNQFLEGLCKRCNHRIDIPPESRVAFEASLDSIASEFLHKGEHYQALIQLELKRILITLDRLTKPGMLSFDDYHDLPQAIHDALNRIEKRCRSISGLPDIMDGIYMDSRYFIRLFKKHVGLSPIRYLNRRRIIYCIRLLQHTKQTISEAAFDSGFNDLRHFNRQFKKWTGVTPTEFRRAGSSHPNIP